MLEQACQQIGPLPAHTSFDTMLETRPEIVVIATPHSLHAPMACAALRAGRLPDYREPFLGEVHLDYVANPQQSSLEMLGDEGWARLNMASAVLEVGRRQQATPIQEHFAFSRDDLFRDQFDSFLAAMNGEPAEVATAQDGVQTTAAVDAILRALQSRQRERVESQNETNPGK